LIYENFRFLLAFAEGANFLGGGPASPRMGLHQPRVDELARIERDRQQLTAVAG
jgi:hypothetical protein